MTCNECDGSGEGKGGQKTCRVCNGTGSVCEYCGDPVDSGDNVCEKCRFGVITHEEEF